MKLKGNKKQANGKSVAIFDTEGQHIGEVAELMTDNGWRFNTLQVTYMAKDGSKKRKNVPAERASEIYRKYRFAKWAFEAVNGNASVTGSMDCDKNAIAITASRGGGYKLLTQLPKPVPVSEPFSAYDRARAGQDRGGMSYEDFARTSSAYTSHRTDSTDIERRSARNMARASEAERQAAAALPKNNGLAYIIASIVEILFLAPMVFGIFALSDTLKARKATAYDVVEAQGHFKEARNLLIGGAVAAVIFAVILIWKFKLLPIG